MWMMTRLRAGWDGGLNCERRRLMYVDPLARAGRHRSCPLETRLTFEKMLTFEPKEPNRGRRPR
jgi:hypothetical protein